MRKMEIAVLGAGGLGRACVDLVSKKKEMKIVAICDSQGYLYSKKGITLRDLSRLRPSDDSIGTLCK